MERKHRNGNEQKDVDTSLKLGLPQFHVGYSEPQPPAVAMPVCTVCSDSKTPLWRKGPEGPRTLCNKCGLKFMRAKNKVKKAEMAT